jgi:hypothetical protein
MPNLYYKHILSLNLQKDVSSRLENYCCNVLRKGKYHKPYLGLNSLSCFLLDGNAKAALAVHTYSIYRSSATLGNLFFDTIKYLFFLLI